MKTILTELPMYGYWPGSVFMYVRGIEVRACGREYEVCVSCVCVCHVCVMCAVCVSSVCVVCVWCLCVCGVCVCIGVFFFSTFKPVILWT